MEMLPETCGVSNSGSKRHMNLVSQEKGRKEQNRTEQNRMVVARVHSNKCYM
jgi:hypothetical protein